MYEILEESSPSTNASFEECTMFAVNEEMFDLASNFLVTLRKDRTDKLKQINGLEALCQITNDVLSDENHNKESMTFSLINENKTS